MTDAELLQSFETRRAERLQKAWTTHAASNPIASDLHDCRRYMVLRQVAWQVRPTPDLAGLETIENGNVKEGPMIRQLQDEGWDVVELQAPFEIRQPLTPGGPRKLIVRGMLDGKIRLGRERIPFDTKDTSQFVFNRIVGEDDLHETIWTRKWWRQLQIYMLGEGNERGLLMLGYRGQRKPILMHLDYVEAERLLQLCSWTVATVEQLEEKDVDHERVDAALNDLGEPYHPDARLCGSCPFRDRACFPPDPAPARSQMRPDLEEIVARMAETADVAREHYKLRELVKLETEGYPLTIAGDYVVEGSVGTRRISEKPAVPAHTQEVWSIETRRVGESR